MSDRILPDTLREAMNDVVSLLDPDACPLEELESDLMRVLMRVGRRVMSERLAQLTPQTAFQEDGANWRPAVESALRMMTFFGPIRVVRPLFRAVRNGPTRCLLTEQFPLVDSWWTPRAARHGARLLAWAPSRQAASLWMEGTEVGPSRTMLDRLPRTLSEAWESNRPELEARVSEATLVPEDAATACVSLDGVYAHMRAPGKAEHKASRRRDGIVDKGPKNYRELSCGVIDLRDREGNRLQTRRCARMPESKKLGLKEQLRSELSRILKERPDLKVVVQGDGALDNWTFLESLPYDYSIVDYFHSVEKLKVGLDHMLGATKPSTDAEHQRLRRILRDEPDGANQVCNALKSYRKAKHKTKHLTALPYFERHKHRMAYADMQSRSLPIGTGVMEGTCKSIVTRRMKQAGMRWDQPGGQAILTLCSLEQSEQFNVAWPIMLQQLRAAA